MDELDRRLILATQRGLPLCAQSYEALAAELGCAAATVMQRLEAMLARDLLPDEPLPPLRIPELRWHNSLRFQPALLPQQVVGNDPDAAEGESPFEMTA